ncbi:hypothetical protein LWI29_016566 [Acer saccharum]|uniref:Uncharacterized protein n=1 Tax=Acer saccharum TaxID=4024 RepID=A0AA39RI14_ACESA|nr:hypothetical protein LWI29_016566 [Acer saccharum]
MRQNFEWKVKRSNKITLHLVYIIDECTWKLKAVRRAERTYFQVKSFINEHSCPLEEIHRRHRQASAVTIGEVVAPRLQQHDGRLMRPKDIIADMKTIYGIQIMYSKAHDALQYALSLSYGTHEETFQLLPYFAYILEQQNPGTIKDLQCTDDGKFLYFFIRNMLQKWFHDRHTAAQSMRHRLTDAAHGVIQKRVEKYSYMTVMQLTGTYSPSNTRENSGREWNLDFTSLCADYYLRETLIDAYSVPIMPVGHPSSWVVPSDIAARVVLNPKSKRQSGHPMEGRHASSSEKPTT